MERSYRHGLVSCPGCLQFVKIKPNSAEVSCPFCGHESTFETKPTKIMTKGRSLAAAALLGSAIAIGACATPVYGAPPAEKPTGEQPASQEKTTEAVTDGGTKD